MKRTLKYNGGLQSGLVILLAALGIFATISYAANCPTPGEVKLKCSCGQCLLKNCVSSSVTSWTCSTCSDTQCGGTCGTCENCVVICSGCNACQSCSGNQVCPICNQCQSHGAGTLCPDCFNCNNCDPTVCDTCGKCSVHHDPDPCTSSSHEISFDEFGGELDPIPVGGDLDPPEEAGWSCICGETGSVSVVVEDNSAPGKSGLIGDPAEVTCGDATESFGTDATVWVVGVDKIKYWKNYQWIDVPDPLYVLKGSTETFKAYRDPEESSGWPKEKPIWSGTGVTTDVNAEPGLSTASVTFGSASSSLNDYKKVKAECGNNDAYNKEINVIVCDIEKKEVDASDDNGNIKVKYEVIPTGATLTEPVTFTAPGITETRQGISGEVIFNARQDQLVSGGNEFLLRCNERQVEFIATKANKWTDYEVDNVMAYYPVDNGYVVKYINHLIKENYWKVTYSGISVTPDSNDIIAISSLTINRHFPTEQDPVLATGIEKHRYQDANGSYDSVYMQRPSGDQWFNGKGYVSECFSNDRLFNSNEGVKGVATAETMIFLEGSTQVSPLNIFNENVVRTIH